MSKAKAQGTRAESWLVGLMAGRGFSARRLAEGGALDEGDVEAVLYQTRWVLESKARQTLNVQKTLGDARRKANGAPVMVWWKRLVKATPDAKRRSPVAGETVVVVLSPEDLFRLLNDAHQTGYIEGTLTEREVS